MALSVSMPCLFDYLSVYLTLFQSIWLSSCLSVCQSVCFCMTIYLSIYLLPLHFSSASCYLSLHFLCVYLEVSLYVYLSFFLIVSQFDSLRLSFCLFVYITLSLPISLPIFLSIGLSFCLSVRLSLFFLSLCEWLSLCLSTNLFVSIDLSFYLSAWLFPLHFIMSSACFNLSCVPTTLLIKRPNGPWRYIPEGYRCPNRIGQQVHFFSTYTPR